MLAASWAGENPAGWLISEKLDGVRAIWTGSELLSRNGKRFNAPASFIAALPAGIALDGELWMGRGKFQATVSAVRGSDWSGVRFMVFDAPEADGGFESRLAVARAALAGSAVAEVVRHDVCLGLPDMDTRLADVVADGGEGICLRRAGSPYISGRYSGLLKRKLADTAEATVANHRENSLTVRWGAVEFGLACIAQPAIGSVVTFSYRGLTDSGRPRFASFVGVRDYE